MSIGTTLSLSIKGCLALIKLNSFLEKNRMLRIKKSYFSVLISGFLFLLFSVRIGGNKLLSYLCQNCEDKLHLGITK